MEHCWTDETASDNALCFFSCCECHCLTFCSTALVRNPSQIRTPHRRRSPPHCAVAPSTIRFRAAQRSHSSLIRRRDWATSITCRSFSIGAPTSIPGWSALGTVCDPSALPSILSGDKCLEKPPRVAGWPYRSHGVRARRQEGREVVSRLCRRLDQSLGWKPQRDTDTERSPTHSRPAKYWRPYRKPFLWAESWPLSARLPTHDCPMVPRS